jgi:hypothetical protein
MQMNPDDAETLPPPTPELVMIGVMLEAHLCALPRKQRERVIERIDARMDSLAALERVVRLRPGDESSAFRFARRHAAAWWGRMGPLLAMQL